VEPEIEISATALSFGRFSMRADWLRKLLIDAKDLNPFRFGSVHRWSEILLR